jgi:preprotein translocase subunit SecG
MTIALLGTLVGTLLGWLMGFLSLFLIMLILIQRGKGGGLTGALGGPGGQSAFGSKAGDTFTVITVVVASIWGFTCAFTMWLLGTHTPTAVTTTNVSAGPGDEAADTTGNELIIPAAGGFGGLGSDDTEETPSSETPSMELTPKTPASEPAEFEAGEFKSAEDAAAENLPATEAEKPAAESAAETPAVESETPESASTDSESETGDN